MRKIDPKYENPIDNIIIDIFDKISPFFKQLGFTANGITTLSLIFGLLSVYSLIKGNILMFAILYFISYFFDCADGHFARKYKMTSKFGDYYDHIKDIIVVILIIIVIFKRNSCSTKTYIISISIILVFLLLMTAQLGCQEKIYKQTPDKTDESPSLSLSTILCPVNPEKGCTYLRWFGCATFTIVFIIVICVIEKSCKKKF